MDAQVAATCFCLLPGHQFWPGRPSQLHGNWFVWWPRLSEDTGAGGLTPSVLVLTPTIRTHCFRQWGQRPELLGHQFWPRRPGRWHRAEGLSLWTPTGWVTIGRSQMEGTPCEGTRHVRGSFYWTLTFGHTLGWPQLSGAPFTGHSAMGPYSKCGVINRVRQLNKVGRRH